MLIRAWGDADAPARAAHARPAHDGWFGIDVDVLFLIDLFLAMFQTIVRHNGPRGRAQMPPSEGNA